MLCIYLACLEPTLYRPNKAAAERARVEFRVAKALVLKIFLSSNCYLYLCLTGRRQRLFCARRRRVVIGWRERKRVSPFRAAMEMKLLLAAAAGDNTQKSKRELSFRFLDFFQPHQRRRLLEGTRYLACSGQGCEITFKTEITTVSHLKASPTLLPTKETNIT